MSEGFTQRVKGAVARRVAMNPVRAKLDRPVASLTFDDVPASAARVGATILEKNNVLGTYYMCGGHTGGRFEGLVQQTRDDIVSLRQAGHEIGCHSFTHADVTHLSLQDRDAERLQNQAYFAALAPETDLVSFAYPYGQVSVGAKGYYAKRFFTARGVMPGINSGIVDFAELRAISLTHKGFDLEAVRALIARAVAHSGWLVFFTHDVDVSPTPYGCRPEELQAVIDLLREARIDILPVKAAAARCMFGPGGVG